MKQALKNRIKTLETKLSDGRVIVIIEYEEDGQTLYKVGDDVLNEAQYLDLVGDSEIVEIE
jgi:hypothetical protein